MHLTQASEYHKIKTVILFLKEFEALWNDLDLVVDGGALGDNQDSKAGSTVIDFTQPNTYKIIRNGTYYDSVLKILNEVCKLVRRHE